MDGFTWATKEMNTNGGRTPTKHRKHEGKGSGIKSPTYGLLEKVKVGKEVNNEEDVVVEVKAKPFCLCLCDTEQETLDGFTYEWI